MHSIPPDIIIPVWNRPVETRRCLARLIETTPDARLIIIDTGSDRETEGILQEVAEALDERALLLSNVQNRGFVAAVNQGLARSDAPFAAVLRIGTFVSPGWLEALMDCAGSSPETGLVIPRIVTDSDSRSRGAAKLPLQHACEADCGSFVAMLVRGSLYASIGAFDVELDGGVWCLKDYTRRALAAGFLTRRAEQSVVTYTEEPVLGSAARRSAQLQYSRDAVITRYGEEKQFCLTLAKAATPADCAALFDLLLVGARRGHRFTVMVPFALFRVLKQGGYGRLHDNIVLHGLPFLQTEGALRREFARLKTAVPEIIPLVGRYGLPIPGSGEALSFDAFERSVVGPSGEYS